MDGYIPNSYDHNRNPIKRISYHLIFTPQSATPSNQTPKAGYAVIPSPYHNRRPFSTFRTTTWMQMVPCPNYLTPFYSSSNPEDTLFVRQLPKKVKKKILHSIQFTAPRHPSPRLASAKPSMSRKSAENEGYEDTPSAGGGLYQVQIAGMESTCLRLCHRSSVFQASIHLQRRPIYFSQP